MIHIAQNDYALISTPAYVNLTGGAADVDGKTWVFDQYNNFTKEVAAAGFSVSGHMGLTRVHSGNHGGEQVSTPKKHGNCMISNLPLFRQALNSIL